VPSVSFGPQADPTDYRPECWSANGRSVVVYFRPDGAVADKSYVDFNFPPPTLLQRLKQLVGW
jgi:hypothetical protein